MPSEHGTAGPCVPLVLCAALRAAMQRFRVHAELTNFGKARVFTGAVSSMLQSPSDAWLASKTGAPSCPVWHHSGWCTARACREAATNAKAATASESRLRTAARCPPARGSRFALPTVARAAVGSRTVSHGAGQRPGDLSPAVGGACQGHDGVEKEGALLQVLDTIFSGRPAVAGSYDKEGFCGRSTDLGWSGADHAALIAVITIECRRDEAAAVLRYVTPHSSKLQSWC